MPRSHSDATRRLRPLAAFFVAVLLCAGLPACASKRGGENARRYDLKGRVVSVDKSRHELVVAHEPVADYMEAMTMPFVLKDEDAFNVVGPGDDIQATLVVADDAYWLENPIITKGVAAGSDASAGGVSPRPGAEVPNLSLVNQDGRRIKLGDYRGRALLVTFVYTRCPLPEYCTLMSTNFAELERELRKEPETYRRTHLLTVSFDPAHDKPEVLKSYGAAHTGRYTEEKFEHWEFATGTPEEVRRVAEFFGLTYVEEKDQIVHSLVTATVAPDGRVHKIYRGNQWKPAEVLKDLRDLLSSRGASE